jgi:signal transduction histidine kinase
LLLTGVVLINFVINAAKYLPDLKKVTAESFIKNNQVMKSVKDAGTETIKTDRQKIFERFYRVKKTFRGFGCLLHHKLLKGTMGKLA